MIANSGSVADAAYAVASVVSVAGLHDSASVPATLVLGAWGAVTVVVDRSLHAAATMVAAPTKTAVRNSRCIEILGIYDMGSRRAVALSTDIPVRNARQLDGLTSAL
jgi:hypothetical protein